MKILVSLNNKNIKDYLNYTNSFIIGLKDFSINYLEFDINEIKELLNYDIELFVAVNRNMFNNDIEELKQKLIELSKLNIKGVLFYDLAVLSIVKELNLNLDLVWNQEHMVTNYNTCNYYYSKGCKYAYTSSDITTEEIKEIHEKSDINLITLFFGYPQVSFSKRKLLTNYFLFNNKKQDKDYYKISSKGSDEYYIKENKFGTSILYGNLLNGILPLKELKDTSSYAVLDEQLINHDLFIKVLDVFNKFLNNELTDEEANNKVKELTGSEDTVFFDKKTIYKVKNEK